MNYTINKIRRKITYKDKTIVLPVGVIHYLNRPFYSNSTISVKNGIYYFGNKTLNFIISPSYKKANFINGKKYEIFIVNADKDKLDCQKLILEDHYLQPPNRGMFLACRKDSEIVACCIVDELTYGNPKGRIKISGEITQKNNWTVEKWNSLNRKEVSEKLNICWLSRVVVSKKHQKSGVGTKMIKSLFHILPNYHPLKSDFIEVITTHEKNGNNSYVPNSENNIFCNLGFEFCHLSRHTHNVLNKKNKNYEPKPADRYYFWKNIHELKTEPPSDNRLFVALAQEPYNWFLSGKKQWELRKAERQFTRKNIRVGRTVELRRGYNTKDSIWGVIDQVLEFKSLEKVFENVYFKKVIPVANSTKQAISISKKILKPSRYSTFIIFKVSQNRGGE